MYTTFVCTLYRLKCMIQVLFLNTEQGRGHLCRRKSVRNTSIYRERYLCSVADLEGDTLEQRRRQVSHWKYWLKQKTYVKKSLKILMTKLHAGLLVILGLVSLAVWSKECGRGRALNQWTWHSRVSPKHQRRTKSSSSKKPPSWLSSDTLTLSCSME